MIPPGGTIGILGGGQLGRMLAIAAAQLGYRTHVFAPEAEQPAADVASRATRASYDDEGALRAFAAAVDVVTCEFENVPAACLALLEALVPVRPGARAFAVAQDRLVEKQFVQGLGGTPAPYAAVDDIASLERAIDRLGLPAVLKTRRFGYDGKGQVRLDERPRAATALADLGGANLVLEGLVPFTSEFSIIVGRGVDGAEAHYPAIANRHEEGILAESLAPASLLPAAHVEEATALVIRIANALDYVGILACEFFETDAGVIFNEMAPRVHNSGHWTIEGAETSQFEQHIRAIAGLPLGSPAMQTPVAIMRNILGDAVSGAHALLADPHAHLHLYGKREAAAGRKMGHVTILRA